MVTNPFSPGFGSSPPVLAGRQAVLDDLADALRAGPSHPAAATLLIGRRGIGKTVLLNAVEDLAAEAGWRTISENALPGFNGRIIRAAAEIAADLAGPTPSRKVTSVKALGFGVDTSLVDGPAPVEDLRAALTGVADALTNVDSGLLITLDEVHSADVKENQVLGHALQHVARREGRPIVFVGAALPDIADTLLAQKDSTFLQRSSQPELGPITPGEVERALRSPLTDLGFALDAADLDAAVNACGGYAFMIQLVGYHLVRQASEPPCDITHDEATEAIEAAEAEVVRLVYAPMVRDASGKDLEFLAAMINHGGDVPISHIRDALNNAASGYVGVYRRRLIEAGLIQSAGYGKVALAHVGIADLVAAQLA